jgi:hypothetical protein
MATSGWGDGTWGSSFWGGFVDADVSVTGVAATSAVGEEGVTGTSVVVETGLEATGVVNSAGLTFLFAFLTSGVSTTGSVGTVTFDGDSNTGTTGLSATTTVGSTTIGGSTDVTVTGVSATTAVNSVLVKIPVNVSVTGLEATSGFLSGWGSSAWGDHIWGGGVFADVGQTLPITGLEATGQSNNPTVIGTCTFSVTGVSGTTALGNALAAAGAIVEETGLTGSVNIGDEAVVGTALISPTGVSASILISGYSATTITKTVTVVSTAGGNKYFIDGVQQDTLELFEGNTYRFDQSDSSNSGHPLRLSTTSNGIHAGGTEYTTGVTTYGNAGDSGSYTEITVATDAPTLYYYCTNHSGMGGQANTPIVYTVQTTTGAPVTTVLGTTALGEETVTAGAGVAVTLAGLSISSGTLAIAANSVLSLTGLSVTGATGEEQVYSLIEPDQLANWVEKAA